MKVYRALFGCSTRNYSNSSELPHFTEALKCEYLYETFLSLRNRDDSRCVIAE